jgi:hypothetical protein
MAGVFADYVNAKVVALNHISAKNRFNAAVVIAWSCSFRELAFPLLLLLLLLLLQGNEITLEQVP